MTDLTDRAIGHYQKRIASVIAVKGGHKNNILIVLVARGYRYVIKSFSMCVVYTL